MKVILECTGCTNQIILPGYRYRARVKRNPNYKPYCNYRCSNPSYTNDPSKKYCPRCKNVKSRLEFYKDKGRHDNNTIYCIPCHKIIGKETITLHPLMNSNNHKKRRWNRKMKLFAILEQTTCVYCEFSIYPALQFGHKNGNGVYDKFRFKNLDQFYNYYIKHPEEARRELEITCANCNWIKRFKDNEQLQRVFLYNRI